ncbi:hypothetical protein [Hoyosella subflava]|uniref:Conserved hypothetical membrane protein n=1 Tax=Hoyosella subflava (strain DSM 45089 / JCM 17490 / NBRC 109087 / DQS3-9A1) TaxID=443218 RepID=F6EJE3_HOYSD|nr:hypothetical protein [Hoyosella subflava]AEF42559.1 Conserved hypothetical membrane protein [Hoyosella subflava DQS3-9A1]
MRVARSHQLIAPVYSAFLSILILAPLLQPGYLLFRDAVSTPRSYLTDSALGLGDAAPRAVPQDWLLSTLSRFIDGGLIVVAILFLALMLGGWGAAALVRAVLTRPDYGLGAGPGAECAAVTVAIWNPYVAERLLQGHWSLLVGYAALPWVAVAALRISRGDNAAWLLLALSIGCAALTPTGAILALVLALSLTVGSLRTHPVRVVGVLGMAAIAATPWLTAALVSGTPGVSGQAGAEAFAARAEPGLATLGSLAGLGGIWNAESVPLSRTTPVALLATAWLLGLVALGAWQLWKARAAEARPLGIVAGLAVVLPALAATPAGISALAAVTAGFPGGGLLRDTQKFVALAMPFYALCVAATVIFLARAASTGLAVAVPALVSGMLIAVLPDLAWGAGGHLRPVHYPAGWAAVAQHVSTGPPHGAVAVLPAGMFRVFPFSGDVVVLDPAPRLLPRDVLSAGDLIVGGEIVRGEGERGQRAQTALLEGEGPGRLLSLGAAWVLVEHNTPGLHGDASDTLAQLEHVYSDNDLTLYRVPGEPADLSAPTAHRNTVIAAHYAWLGLIVFSGLILLAQRRRKSRGAGSVSQL